MASSGLLLVQHSRWYLPVTVISSIRREKVLFFSREAEHLEVSLCMSKGADLPFVSYPAVSARLPACNLLVNAM